MRKTGLFFIVVLFLASAIYGFSELARQQQETRNAGDITRSVKQEKTDDGCMTYRYKTKNGDTDFTTDKKIIENRLKKIGVKYKVKVERENTLAISVKGKSFSTDEEKESFFMSISAVTEKGMLTVEGENGDVIVDYGDIKRAESEKVTVNGESQYQVRITLTKTGADKFYTGTANNIGKRVDIIYNDQLISSPLVQMGISGGEFVITGMEDNELLSKVIAACINSEPLQNDFYQIPD